MSDSLYPIRAVSKLTGISIDTLRAWERRYQAVSPQRDDNRRLYSREDIERLQLLNAAVGSGHSIGRLADLSDGELRGLISASVEPVEAGALKTDDPEINLRTIQYAIERLDFAAAERELSLLAALLTPRDLVHRVARPLLRYVGEAWHEGRLGIAHEHMTSALLRNLLGAMVSLHRRASPVSRLLFATPSGERHEMGILMCAMLAVGGGLGMIYLGADLPGSEIVMAAQQTAPEAVVLGFVGAEEAEARIKSLCDIADRLPSQIELWVGGTVNKGLINEIKKTRAVMLEDFDMLERHLTRLGARF